MRCRSGFGPSTCTPGVREAATAAPRLLLVPTGRQNFPEIDAHLTAGAIPPTPPGAWRVEDPGTRGILLGPSTNEQCGQLRCPGGGGPSGRRRTGLSCACGVAGAQWEPSRQADVMHCGGLGAVQGRARPRASANRPHGGGALRPQGASCLSGKSCGRPHIPSPVDPLSFRPAGPVACRFLV